MEKTNIILSFLIFTLLLSSCIEVNRKEEFKRQNFKGVIVEVYQKPSDHYEYHFKIDENKIIFDYTSSFFPKSWEFVEVGDSIIKIEDSLKITIKKKNGDYKDFKYD
jgi:hypothetical protein